MVRSLTWMSLTALGLVLILALPVPAQTFSSDEEPTPLSSDDADGAGQDESQSDDGDTAETPSDEDDSGTYKRYRQSLGLAPQDYSEGDTPSDAESTPSDEPQQPTTEIIKERFPNGSVRIEREVTQDTQGNYVNHGPWKMWDERGNVVAQGEYFHGQRTGTWVRWYRGTHEAKLLTQMPYQQFPGPFISQATFKDGQLDGAWTIYDAKQRKISQWHFRDGRRHGDSTWWYATGRKLREIQYRDGDIDGQWSEWAPAGSQLINDKYEAGRKLAVKTAHHNGGAKKSQGMYLFAREIEQTPDDWWECKVHVTTKTGKDEKHGPWASWYANGQRQLEGTYEHDVQVGPFAWWHANGQKSLEGRFVQGKQDGAWTWWYPSGQKSIQGQYAGGNPTGRWTWWKEDGKVAQSADLSHSEGVVVDMPSLPDPKRLPQAKQPKPTPRLQR